MFFLCSPLTSILRPDKTEVANTNAIINCCCQFNLEMLHLITLCTTIHLRANVDRVHVRPFHFNAQPNNVTLSQHGRSFITTEHLLCKAVQLTTLQDTDSPHISRTDISLFCLPYASSFHIVILGALYYFWFCIHSHYFCPLSLLALSLLCPFLHSLMFLFHKHLR